MTMGCSCEIASLRVWECFWSIILFEDKTIRRVVPTVVGHNQGLLPSAKLASPRGVVLPGPSLYLSCRQDW